MFSDEAVDPHGDNGQPATAGKLTESRARARHQLRGGTNVIIHLLELSDVPCDLRDLAHVQ